MNAPQESLLEELLDEIKAEGIHFASVLLAKLAGHVTEEVVKGGAPCPPGQIRDPRTGQCITDPG